MLLGNEACALACVTTAMSQLKVTHRVLSTKSDGHDVIELTVLLENALSTKTTSALASSNHLCIVHRFDTVALDPSSAPALVFPSL